MAKDNEITIRQQQASERDISKYFCVDKNSSTILKVGLRPDAFFVAWPSKLDVDGFLNTSSKVIDSLAQLQPPMRPTTLGNPADAEIPVKLKPKKVIIPPSYSGFGHGWVQMDSENLDLNDLTFNQLEWPLNISNIKRVVKSKEGRVFYGNPQRNFVRVEGEFCSIHFNGDQFPRSFTYWSHVYPPQLLLETYQETVSKTKLTDEQFSSTLDELVLPYVGKNYYQLK